MGILLCLGGTHTHSVKVCVSDGECVGACARVCRCVCTRTYTLTVRASEDKHGECVGAREVYPHCTRIHLQAYHCAPRR